MWTNVTVWVGRIKPRTSELLFNSSNHRGLDPLVYLKESEDQGQVLASLWDSIWQSWCRVCEGGMNCTGVLKASSMSPSRALERRLGQQPDQQDADRVLSAGPTAQ